MGIGDAVRSDIITVRHPVHVLVPCPPASGNESGPVLELSVVRLEFGHIIMGLDVGGNGPLAHNKLSRARRARFIGDSIIVVVDAVIGLPGRFEVSIPKIPRRRARRPDPHAVAVEIPRVDKVQPCIRLVPIRIVIIRLGDAVAGNRLATDARIHVDTEDDVLQLGPLRVVGRPFVCDVIMPENHILRLDVRPLESAYLHTHAEAAPRRITAVGKIVLPPVVVIVIHNRETLLISRRPFAKIPVPGTIPCVVPVRPRAGPGPGIIADGRRESAIGRHICFEIPGTRLKAHHLPVGTRRLPFPVPGLHNIGGDTGLILDL